MMLPNLLDLPNLPELKKWILDRWKKRKPRVNIAWPRKVFRIETLEQRELLANDFESVHQAVFAFAGMFGLTQKLMGGEVQSPEEQRGTGIAWPSRQQARPSSYTASILGSQGESMLSGGRTGSPGIRTPRFDFSTRVSTHDFAGQEPGLRLDPLPGRPEEYQSARTNHAQRPSAAADLPTPQGPQNSPPVDFQGTGGGSGASAQAPDTNNPAEPTAGLGGAGAIGSSQAFAGPMSYSGILADLPTMPNFSVSTPDFSYTPPELPDIDAPSTTADGGGSTSSVVPASTAVVGAPTANDDHYSTDEDAPLSVTAAAGILANDGSSELTVVSVSGPEHGSLAWNEDGSFTYTPNDNYNGNDAFTYQVSDGNSGTAAATVTISIQPANDAPVVQDDNYITPCTSTLVGRVTEDSSDPDGDLIVYSIVSGPTSGWAEMNADGSFTYSPEYLGTYSDSFVYQADDGHGGVSMATVWIDVAAEDVTGWGDDSSSADGGGFMAFSMFSMEGEEGGGDPTSGPTSGPTSAPTSPPPTSSPTQAPTEPPTQAPTEPPPTLPPTSPPTPDPTYVPPPTYPPITYSEYAVHVNYGEQVGVGGFSPWPQAPSGLGLGQIELDPSNGTISVVSTTSLSGYDWIYTPNLNADYTDTFRYYVEGGNFRTHGTVHIYVHFTDFAPVALNDDYSMSFGDVLSGSVGANDSDANGDTLTYQIVSTPLGGGLLDFHSDGSFSFTPNVNHDYTYTFLYQVNDPFGHISQAYANVNVHFSPFPPQAADDEYWTNDGRITLAASQSVLDNDLDPDSNLLGALLVARPSHGTITFNSDGSFDYLAFDGYRGDDSFIYAATDAFGNQSSATVQLHVSQQNRLPVGHDDYVVVPQNNGGVAQFSLNAIWENDFDPDSNITPLTRVVSQPAHGQLSEFQGRIYYYTPDPGYVGVDSFTYYPDDLSGEPPPSAINTVHILVTNQSGPVPTTNNDVYILSEDTVLTVPSANGLLVNDGNSNNSLLHVTLATLPLHGKAVVQNDGSFEYTPDANFSGSDFFYYYVWSENAITPAWGRADFIVQAINDAPEAADDFYVVGENYGLYGWPSLLANDRDDESSVLSATIASGPSHGSIILNSDGSFSYSPEMDFTGIVHFSYYAEDAGGLQTLATAAIWVSGPSTTDAVFHVEPGSTVEGNVAIGYGLPSYGAAMLSSYPLRGGLDFNIDGSFRYFAYSDFTGVDYFTYRLTWPTGYSAETTVRFNVGVTNNLPVAVGDLLFVTEDIPLVVSGTSLFANDTDAEGDSLSFVLVTGPAHGLLVSNGNGTYTYTPNTDFNGQDSFTYKAFDGIAYSNVATVSLSIAAINDAPVPRNDSYSVAEDGVLTVNALAGLLANDSDVDSGSFSISASVGPQHGTLLLNPDGSFTYTPFADFNGSDSFSYKISDGLLESSSATVTLTVTAVNDAPLAADDKVATNEDIPVVISAANLLANDSEIDGDSLSIVVVAQPQYGALVNNGNGTFTYTPDVNAHGPDSFTYKVFDGVTYSNVATVTVNVASVNDAPVAVDESLSTVEGVPLLIAAASLLANDSDVDGDVLYVAIVAQPQHGSLADNGDGTYTYTPDSQYSGPDSFTYKVFDSAAYSNVVTVALTVIPANSEPVATDDELATYEDAFLVVAATGLLANDSDPDGDPLTATIVTGPTNGLLVDNGDGTWTYAPFANFYGTDSFTYVAADGALSSQPATVSIAVAPVNDAPVVQDESYSLAEDGVLTIDLLTGVLANDSDIEGSTLAVASIVGPTNGSLTLNLDGSFTYAPNPNFNGVDSFTYTATDGELEGSPATVTITVTPVADTPVAANNAYSVAEDKSLAVSAGRNVLLNDTDGDGDLLTATLVSDVANGTLVFNTDGTFSYTPFANFNGSDSFSYTASDGGLTSNIATVTFTVTPVNDAPVAVTESYTTAEDTALVVDAAAGVLANDADIDSPTLTAILYSGPAHGTVTLNQDGSFTYAPAANYAGADSFRYRANDGAANSAVITVNLTVTPIPDAPVAVNNSYTVAEDTTLAASTSRNVLTNDKDADGNSLTAVLVAGPGHGTVTLNADGTFIYTPEANFNGTDSFTYSATDGGLDSNVATVTLTVTPRNDAPVAAAESYTAIEETLLIINAASGVLANDTDIDSPVLSAVLVTAAAHGVVTLNSDGSFTYIANTNYVGIDTFKYRANDGSLNSSTTTVTITVTGVNDPPVANDNTYTVAEDKTLATSASRNVLANDQDVDGDVTTAVLVNTTEHGTLTLYADGTFTYTPDLNWNGTDYFTYYSTDGLLDSNVATVTLIVTPVNDAPVGAADAYSIAEDQALAIAAALGVLQNDSDIDSPALSAVLYSGPAHGTVELLADGSFLYTPTADYVGLDTFRYRASDGALNSAVMTVSITVTQVNDGPTAVDNTYTVGEDRTLAASTSRNVLTNDKDLEKDVLSATLVDGPQHGTVVLNSDGTFTYTPDLNWNGTDSFTYRASDAEYQSNVATVFINVTPANDAPVGAADTYSIAEDGVLVVDAATGVLANDTDIDSPSLTAVLYSAPTRGTVTLAADGSFVYTPQANYTGVDTFRYRASDGSLNSAVMTVTINVAPPMPDPPVATNDAYSVNEDATLGVSTARNVLKNDVDPDKDPLTAILVTNVQNGVLVLNTDGTFSYKGNANFFGTDSFTYKATDGVYETAIATVTLTVNPVNDAPVATNDSYQARKNGTLTVSLADGVLKNDSDIDSPTITAVYVSGPTHGTVALNADGSFVYTPTTGYAGNDSFKYYATDGNKNSATRTVTISVSATNHAPVATGETFTTLEDGVLTIASPGLLANDADSDNDPLTVSAVTTGPQHGSLTWNANGSFTYTPTTNYHGFDSFTYTIADGFGGTASATATINVTAVNDVVATSDKNFATDEDVAFSFTIADLVGSSTDVDGDVLSLVIVDGSNLGGALVQNADGSYTYAPAADRNGPASFTYRIFDGTEASNLATISINVAAKPDAPVATNDGITTDEDLPVTFSAADLLGNDWDVDGGSFTLVNLVGPSFGVLVDNGDDTFTYTPRPNDSGVFTFTYQAFDGALSSNVATVSIHVAPKNDAPMTTSDTLPATEDTPLVFTAADLLANDADVDNSTSELSIVLVDQTQLHGSLIQNADSSYTYTPELNYHGPSSFTYRAFDGADYSAETLVTIAIASVNDAPTAVDNSYTFAHGPGAVLTGNLLLNDSDLEGDSFSVLSHTDPAHGSVSIAANGSFTYTPAAGFVGSDSFTYTIQDAFGAEATATVHISVTNDPPVADDLSITIYQHGVPTGSTSTSEPGVPASFAASATDANHDSLVFSVDRQPSFGTLDLHADGSFTYTPDPSYLGLDFFTYRVYDGYSYSNTATVSITIAFSNAAPIAANDIGFSVAAGASLTIAAATLLANDSDPNGDAVTITSFAYPSNHGSLIQNSARDFVYTPDSSFSGPDSFTYTLSDGFTTSTATVSITVAAVNRAPNAADDSGSVAHGSGAAITGNVLANDSDPDGNAFTVVAHTQATRGSVVIAADGAFTYTPETGFVGSDSFSYTIQDSLGATSEAVVHLSVLNTPPAAGNDTGYSVVAGRSITIAADDLLDNDHDADGDSFSITSFAYASTHGVLVRNANGSFTYTPNAGFVGSDSFTYVISDEWNASAPATVSINVIANGAPTATDLTFIIEEDTTFEMLLPYHIFNVANDPEGDPLTFVIDHLPAHGVVTVTDNYNFKYKLAKDYVGDDELTYHLSDGVNSSNFGTIRFTATPVNDPPQGGVVDTYRMTEGSSLYVPKEIGLLANDTDVDTDPSELTASLGYAPPGATVVVEADGSFTVTPDAEFSSFYGFSYVLSDGEFTTGPYYVSVEVVPVNDAPVAQNDDYTWTGGSLTVDAQHGALANDSDIDTINGELAVYLAYQPSNGSITLNADGSFVYTPFRDTFAYDSFTYVVQDGQGGVAYGSVTIAVSPTMNHAPVAVNDFGNYLFGVDGDGGIPPTPGYIGDVDVLANDYDPDGDTLEYVTGYLNGNIIVYAVTDGQATSWAALYIAHYPFEPVYITALDDHYETNEEGVLTVSAANGVQVNDTSSQPFMADRVSGRPQNGKVALNFDGSFTYTPDKNFTGTDSFTYEVFSGTSDFGYASVYIDVGASNDAPEAAADGYAVGQNGTLNGSSVLTNDRDIDETIALTAVLKQTTANGNLVLNEDGTFLYTPAPGYVGIDSFTYAAKDSEGVEGNIVTVTIHVNPIQSAGDSYILTEDSELYVQNSALGILGNDGVDLSAIQSIEIVDGPANAASFWVDGAGRLYYKPNADFNGMDGFSYRVITYTGASDIAHVVLYVQSAPDVPKTTADNYSVDQYGVLNIERPDGVLANDQSPDYVDNRFLVAELALAPLHGALTLNADGSFVYRPRPGFRGTDSFTYTAKDPSGQSQQTLVSIQVGGLDSDHDLINDSAEIAFGTDPFTADNDPDGDGLVNYTEIYTVGSDPLDIDTDNDTLNDDVEVRAHLDPLHFDDINSDTDDDGILLGTEVVVGTNPYKADTDGDGLDDDVEYFQIHTNPTSSDTDGDLLPDGFEVGGGLNPFTYDNPDADYDTDGLSNLEEAIYRSLPLNPDSDGDGVKDGDEVDQGSDPLDETDEGKAPLDEDVIDVVLTVGDHSGSHSERYNLVVGPIVHQARQYGVVETNTYKFETGQAYDFNLVHTGTKLTGGANWDWTALIDVAMADDGQIIIKDPNEILGEWWYNKELLDGYEGGSIFWGDGKFGTLYIPRPDIDVVAAAQDLDEEEEETVGYAISRNSDDDDMDWVSDDDDTDGVPGEDDLLEIHLAAIGLAGLKGTFEITVGSGIWLYKDAQKREQILGTPTFTVDATKDSTFWAECFDDTFGPVDITARFIPDPEQNYTVLGTAATDKITLLPLYVDLGAVVSTGDESPGGTTNPIEIGSEIYWVLNEKSEETKGRVISLNWDDDDGDSPGQQDSATNVVSDRDDPDGVEFGDDDLQKLVISVPDYIQGDNVGFQLEFDDEEVAIWKDVEKRQRYQMGDTLPSQTTTVYVEGISASENQEGSIVTLNLVKEGHVLGSDSLRIIVATPAIYAIGRHPTEFDSPPYHPDSDLIDSARKILGYYHAEKRGSTYFLSKNQAISGFDHVPLPTGPDLYFTIDIVRTLREAKLALATENSIVIVAGHGQFGLGPDFTSDEFSRPVSNAFNVSTEFSSAPFDVVLDSDIYRGDIAPINVAARVVEGQRFWNADEIELDMPFVNRDESGAWYYYRAYMTDSGEEIWQKMVFVKAGDNDLVGLPLRYRTLYLANCSSGYFVDSFNHGTVFYTRDSVAVRPDVDFAFQIMAGKSPQQIVNYYNQEIKDNTFAFQVYGP